jgi:hypothetical protein
LEKRGGEAAWGVEGAVMKEAIHFSEQREEEIC